MKNTRKLLSFLLAATMAASLVVPAAADNGSSVAPQDNDSLVVSTTEDGVTGENKDIEIKTSGVGASEEVVYGTTIVWEDPTFTYTVDGGTTTRWDPETHKYTAANGAVSGSFDKDSIKVKVYNHSNAKIDASCFVGASASATTTSYKVSGYDVTLAVSNPDGNTATLPAAEAGSDLESVNTTFTLGISGDGMSQYATDLIAGAASEAKMGTVVVVVGKYQAPAPVLAASDTWYKSEVGRDTVTTITMCDNYTPTGSETESWDASAAGDGGVMCYLSGTDLIIAGNGSGRIVANEDSTSAFLGFDTITGIQGLQILDTSHVKNMCMMFNGCFSITSLDVSNFDTSNVTNMSTVFGSMNSLTSLDLSTWNTSMVTRMSCIFYFCTALTDLNVSGWDTSNVTDMDAMFRGCSALTTLDVSGFDTSKVTDMSMMFDKCAAVQSLDLSNFNTANVTRMDDMFSSCLNITVLNLSSFDTSNVTEMNNMFYNCSSLRQLDLSSFNTSNVRNMAGMFRDIAKLEYVTLGKTFKFVVSDWYIVIFPTPSSSNITGADGKWYDSTTGVGYTPEELLDVVRSETVTYLAVKPNA